MTSIDSLYQLYLKHPQISTDTRTISSGCLFFALKGENFDANQFAEKAIEDGAAYAVIDHPDFKLDERYLLVPDALEALQQLATLHRSQLSIPVIGLTGSNGKTTTKELINSVLSEKYRTFATRGNLNNHIGVPLSILSIAKETEIAVIEMGANHQKEIEFLCRIAQPTHGLITNVGLAHLDGFGGFEGVKKGKAELYAYLKAHGGIAFVCQDSPYLPEMARNAGLEKLNDYGSSSSDSISGTLLKSDPFIEISWTNGQGTFHTILNLTGAYNFENILAAVSIADFFELNPQQINKGLSGYAPKNNRSQITKTEHNTVICDFYNANPSSMSAALKNIALISAEHKTVVIGDMFELGAESAEQHNLIAREAALLDLDRVILIGKQFYTLKDELDVLFFERPEEAKAYLESNPVKDNLVLLKGSRGMALEQLLPLL